MGAQLLGFHALMYALDFKEGVRFNGERVFAFVIEYLHLGQLGAKYPAAVEAKFPEAKQAYLTQEEAWKNGDIGIENAKPEDIRDALSKARATAAQKNNTFSNSDLFELGLAGGDNAAQLRNQIGRKLGIGYGNTKLFLRRLNEYGITREELEDAWTSCTRMQQSEE